MHNIIWECRITETDRRDLALITFYEEGHTYQETATKFGLSLSYTKTKISNIVNVSRPLELQDKAWFEACQNGLSIEEVAKKFDAFAPFVQRRIAAYYPLYYPAP